MRAVMLDVPEDMLRDRERRGADRWDEMWEGVLHMNPPPSLDHQDIEADLVTWVKLNWERPLGNKVRQQAAISPDKKWDQNYRTPDLSLLTPDRFTISQRTHLNGPPNVVVEICSPDDETYEKVGFYADVRIPEVWVIHRDSKEVEMYVLGDDGYEQQTPGRDAWLASESTGIEFRTLPGKPKFEVRIAGQKDTKETLPYD